MARYRRGRKRNIYPTDVYNGEQWQKYVRFGTIVPDSDPTEVSAWTAWVEYAIKTDLDSTTTALTER